MAKLLLDTSVYILKIRGELASEMEEELRRALPLTFLSSVVAYELYRGAIDRPGKRLIDHLVAPFERTGRVVTPSHVNWLDAARIVTGLVRKEAALATKVPALQNDTLIALSSRHVGAMVWTNDAEDFSLIRQQQPFRLRIIERRSSRPPWSRLHSSVRHGAKTLDARLRRHDSQKVIPAQAGIQEPYIQVQGALVRSQPL